MCGGRVDGSSIPESRRRDRSRFGSDQRNVFLIILKFSYSVKECEGIRNGAIMPIWRVQEGESDYTTLIHILLDAYVMLF